MSYVLVRTSDGAFVARPGSASSYTLALQKAETFQSKEQAERNKCGNEVAVCVDSILRRN